MAGRRIAKSAVDWVAFAERVPAGQKDAFRAFKAKSDNFVSRVHRYPENMPAIDFGAYKTQIAAAPGLVDKFEKAYASLSIPYPKDKNNFVGEIEKQKKESDAITEQEIKTYRQFIQELEALKGKLDSLPSLENMTIEMYMDYFPDQAPDPVNKPTFWPHTKSNQPGNDPNEIK